MMVSGKDIEGLRYVRRLYQELLQLRKDLKECGYISISSPSMDGMPRGGGTDKMAAYVIRQDELSAQEERLEKQITYARTKAYQICRRITSSTKARLFFEAYCADLRPIETAQKISGADDQTVRTYLKMLGEAQ